MTMAEDKVLERMNKVSTAKRLANMVCQLNENLPLANIK
jgi:hypothetical protein